MRADRADEYTEPVFSSKATSAIAAFKECVYLNTSKCTWSTWVCMLLIQTCCVAIVIGSSRDW